MHIAEGVLSAPVLMAGGVIAVAGLYIGLRKLRENQIALCGTMAAAFFIASLIHVPIGLSNAHLVLTGLTGIILGWAAFPAIFTGLALQALLFQYGGLTTLGVNTASMGSAAVAAWYIFQFFKNHFSSQYALRTGSFVAGFLGVGIAALLTAVALAFTNEGFMAAAIALLLAHLPIMIAEGLISMIVVDFLMRFRPALIGAVPTKSRGNNLCSGLRQS